MNCQSRVTGSNREGDSAMRGWTMASVSILLLAALALVGMPAAVSAQGDDVITLTVLNYLDQSVAGLQREEAEIWEAFTAAYPHIRIEREDLFLEAFHQKTEAYAAAGQLPDVLYMWPGGRSTTLHVNRLVKDLTPLLGDAADEFSPAALAPQAGGYLGMIPIGLTSTHVMFVNTKMLDDLGLAVPETYDDLVAMVPTLRAAGKEVILMGAEDDWVVQSTLFSMIAGRLAGNEFFDAVLAGEAKFTDPPFVNALRFYRQLYDDGVLSLTNLLTSYGEAKPLFASGRAPFLIDGDWATGAFLTDPATGEALIPPEEQHHYTLTVFPAIPGEINSRTTSSLPGTGFGINAAIPAGSAKEQAAWTLVQWLTSERAQQVRLETGAAFPSRKGVSSDELEPLAQARALFYGQYGGTYVLDDIFPSEVYGPINVGLQEIGLGFSTPEEVAAAVQRAFDAWSAAR